MLFVCSCMSTPLCMREKDTTTTTIITQEATRLAQKKLFHNESIFVKYCGLSPRFFWEYTED